MEVKTRSCKTFDRNQLSALVKVTDENFFTVSLDNCVKHLKFDVESKEKAEKIKGFLCPYCLRLFLSHRALYVEHMGEHKGPVKCDICEVWL